MSSFSSYKSLVTETLERETRDSKDLIKKLVKFVSLGKGIRGSLVVQTYLDLGGNDTQKPALVGAALELVQAGLLIHDDIIDQDETRRGEKALWVELQDNEGRHYGESQAICVGDIAFFTAFE